MRVHARAARGTVRIGPAFRRRHCPGLRPALEVRVTGCTGRARARGLVVLSAARGAVCARVLLARGPADPVQAVARLVAGAVLVVLAHDGDAGDERVALHARRACALSAVLLDAAGGAAAAGGRGAGVLAFRVDAGSVEGTFAVGLALHWNSIVKFKIQH